MNRLKNVMPVTLGLVAGLMIAGVGAFAVTPAMAAGYHVDAKAQVTNVAHWDHLNVRKWPGANSHKVGELAPHTHVWVERCVSVPYSSDWCLVERNYVSGWVNSKFLTLVDY